MEIRKVLTTWQKVLSLYGSFIFRFSEVHPDLPNGQLLEDIITKAEHGAVELRLPRAFADTFNKKFADTSSQMLKELGEPDFTSILAASFAVRALQCVVTLTTGWMCGLAAGLLQFLVAPLSFTGSFIRLLTNVSDCLLHYACSAVAAIALSWLDVSWPILRIDTTFMAVFFTVDFLLNLLVYWLTSESFGLRRLLVHIVYGTFNTKTYFLVVLGCLLGTELNPAVLLAASVLTMVLRQKGHYKQMLDASGWPCFTVCFYVEHRIGHLPVVYQHAHKMHHYLHDSTAFDAHIYGSGMNEEFFWVLAETLPCLFAPSYFFPYFLNLDTLYSSWTNKSSHTRTAEGQDFGLCDEANFHADHHTLHRANFGSSMGILLDVYFGTTGANTKGASGLSYSRTSDPCDPDKFVIRIERSTCSLRVASAATQSESTPAETVDGPAAVSSNRIISEAELATKTSRENGIWIALDGDVIDVTAFSKHHPGGSQILLDHAGTDATVIFKEVGHSQKAKAMAAKRRIGRLETALSPDEVSARRRLC
mmetsp:Transcript_62596/g.146901  ORF Transcript_62596/g.146901 Transcript_62596/m.146901 type:complete len:535 (-) Transcript_62596:114-1718(-)